MDDTSAIMRTLEETALDSAVIVGAGYIGLEMAEALAARGLAVTQAEHSPRYCPPSTRSSAPSSAPSWRAAG